MHTGRVTERLCVIGGKTYYFDAEGLPAHGMVHVDEDSYFFDDYGVMTTGFLEIAGRNIILCRAGKHEKYGDRPERNPLSLQRRRKSDQGDKNFCRRGKGAAIADYAMPFEGKPYKTAVPA